MTASPHLIEYDNLSIRLLSALAGNALGNLSTSAGKMLDVACFFFDKDISKSLLSFHTLYLENSHLDNHKDDINQQADDIFAAAQLSVTAAQAVDFDAASQKKITELANVQKELEALIQQDSLIKKRMVPVMQCMQYEDLISNRIQRLILCWEYMILILRKPKEVSINQALEKFNHLLASEDEHQKFFESVLKCQYNQQDINDVSHEIEDVSDLLERFFAFSHASLEACVLQTQQAFDELMMLLDLVTGESKDVAYLFTDENESLSDIKSIISKSHHDPNNHQVSQVIKEIAIASEQHSNEAKDIIQSFMMALQSQDMIRQNIENIAHVHQVWSFYRHSIKTQKKINANYLIDFGQDLIGKMTSRPEQVIVEGFIPGVDAGSEEEESIFF